MNLITLKTGVLLGGIPQEGKERKSEKTKGRIKTDQLKTRFTNNIVRISDLRFIFATEYFH